MGGMRLGFHYHIPVWLDEDVPRLPGYLAMFVDSLADRVDELVCFLHDALPHERVLCDTEIRSPNVSCVSLGPHLPVHRRLLARGHLGVAVVAAVASLDHLLIRGPSPLLPGLGRLARRHAVSTSLLIVGDYVRSAGSMAQPVPKRLAALSLALLNRAGQRRIARRSLVFVNSRELFEGFEGVAAKLIETRTTTLRLGDLVSRPDTCGAPPFVLLYAGRFDWAKGLGDIGEAVLALLNQGMDLRLEIVGWDEGSGAVEKGLRQMFATAGCPDRFVCHGRKAAGPELLALYRSADIYLTASQLAEGFPRTIWEAMASSTPVIATRVGSVPHFLEDGKDALLVPPKDPGALAGAIERLCRDPELRKRFILNGHHLASENTLERRAQEMIEKIKEWAEGN